ncbi:DUF2087 domain-containing protein [Falsarthrobacter nasiphocae]|uniref:DUF2087 domain-containing protein n=1 Tax=Falsarthrobacter nasiphocae TaxID=189863 RepID=A0AAE4C740_9MICC|nr:DUF2087 domain-containing protein [Falsarthrobacter nasiphocae]MDR6892134.1 hypothetical protein [Falsarthrobacter nasiphocae]
MSAASSDALPLLAALANENARRALALAILGQLGPEGVPGLPPRKSATAIERARPFLRPDGDGGFTFDESVVVALMRAGAEARSSESAAIPGFEAHCGQDGRLVSYPAKPGRRGPLLAALADRALGPGRTYTEPEVNEALAAVAEDVVTLRRYLVDAGLLERSVDGGEYRRRVDPAG